jgi:hypothetical protein
MYAYQKLEIPMLKFQIPEERIKGRIKRLFFGIWDLSFWNLAMH